MKEKHGSKIDAVLDNRMRSKRSLVTFLLVLTVLVIIDFFVHRQAHLLWEDFPEFFPICGFVSVFLVVLAAQLLRLFIKKDESYYE